MMYTPDNLNHQRTKEIVELSRVTRIIYKSIKEHKSGANASKIPFNGKFLMLDEIVGCI